jgi:hypothetical protein
MLVDEGVKMLGNAACEVPSLLLSIWKGTDCMTCRQTWNKSFVLLYRYLCVCQCPHTWLVMWVSWCRPSEPMFYASIRQAGHGGNPKRRVLAKMLISNGSAPMALG